MPLNAILLVLLWGLVAGWLPSLRRGRKQRAVWLTFLPIAIIKTISLQPIATAIQSALGTNADAVIKHLLAIAAAVSLLRFVALITGRPPRRYQVVLGLVVAAVLAGLFTVARDGIHSSADDLLAEPHTAPVELAYWLLLEVYLGTVLCTGCLLVWRVSRVSPTNPLRVGMWLMCAGTGLNAVYAAYKSAYLVAHAAGAELPKDVVAAISDTMLPVAGLLIVSGVLVPGWSLARELVGLRLSMRALAPLWRTMRETFPEMILYVSEKLPSADGVLATARLRLYRRLIEIRDGMLELRGYVPADTAGQAREFLAARGVHSEHVAEACWIEVALRRKRAGGQPCPGGWEAMPGGADEQEEARWLAKVSRAHHKSRHPAEFAERHQVSPSASAHSPAPTP
ncbi:MAB_1171c family putative transporter [Kibdelosporangium aridum]|uniref:MAB_1171c family putative transporter n=1 Tax=Kibdelosporangium aridum TaxID=2030 RepID=UPI000526D16B